MRCMALTVACLCLGMGTAQAQPAPSDPAGWGWGPSLVFWDNLSGDFTLASEDDVMIDEDGIVRVLKKSDVRTSMAFEAHHAFAVSSSLGLGPFVNVVSGGDFIQAVGTGGVVVLKRADSTVAMTIGVGVLVELEVIKLADGFVDGQLAPSSTLKFIRREESSLQVWVGVGF